ncbi:DUF6454 family protein [soil metagenome]
MRFRASSAGFAALVAVVSGTATGSVGGAPTPDARVAQRFGHVTRTTPWTLVRSIPIPFRTFHPQGMVKIGEDFYVSSVEVTTAPKKREGSPGGHDRDAGAGVGHLFRIGPDGALLADLKLGEGSIYHPGGVDFDGRFLWVPTAEYRPDSRSILYRVDPQNMTAKVVARFGDHVGALSFDRERRELFGVSWGSRRFYRWRIGAAGALTPVGSTKGGTPNPEHYIDYQDCHGVDRMQVLCSGLATYASAGGAPALTLGGIDLIDVRDGRPVWQVPIELRSPSGRPMTQNPFFVEATTTGLRAYFMPDDDASTIYIFDAAVR